MCKNPQLWDMALIGDIPAIKYQLENGADMDCRGGVDQCTAIHIAIKTNLPEAYNIAVIFTEEGCDLNSTDKHGSTPLHDAVRNGSRDIVELLVVSGAHADIANDKGYTALCISLLKSDLKTSRLVQKAYRNFYV
jgi:ankyrin repeat protein